MIIFIVKLNLCEIKTFSLLFNNILQSNNFLFHFNEVLFAQIN